MKKNIFISSIILGALTLTSCVSKKKYAELETNYKSLQTDFNRSQIDLGSCTTRVQSLEDMLAQERATNQGLKKTLTTLQNSLDKSITQGNVNISKLVDEINASNKYIQHLVNTKNKSDSLNVVLTNNLTRSLSREELRDVDVQVLKGVVYIRSEERRVGKECRSRLVQY